MFATKTNITCVVKLDYRWKFIPGIDIWIVSPRKRTQAVPGALIAHQIYIVVPFFKARNLVLKVVHFTPCSDAVKNAWIFISSNRINLPSILRKYFESLYYNFLFVFSFLDWGETESTSYIGQ